MIVDAVDARLKVVVPRTPNFVRLPHNDAAIPIEQLSDDDLKILGDAWTATLIERARLRRKG